MPAAVELRAVSCPMLHGGLCEKRGVETSLCSLLAESWVSVQRSEKYWPRGAWPGDCAALPAGALAPGDGVLARRCALAALSSAPARWKSMLSIPETPLSARAPRQVFCLSVPSPAQSYSSSSQYLFLGSAAPSV